VTCAFQNHVTAHTSSITCQIRFRITFVLELTAVVGPRGTFPGPRIIGIEHSIAHRTVFADSCCIHILNIVQVLIYFQNELRVYVL
jgi:hypothetical protein